MLDLHTMNTASIIRVVFHTRVAEMLYLSSLGRNIFMKEHVNYDEKCTSIVEFEGHLLGMTRSR